MDGAGTKSTGIAFLLGLTCAVSVASLVVAAVALFECKQLASASQVASGQLQTLAQQNAEIIKLVPRPVVAAAPMPLPAHLPAPESHAPVRRQAEKEPPAPPKNEIPDNGKFTLLNEGAKTTNTEAAFKLLVEK